MFMYPFRKLSVHTSGICTVQFVLAFKVRALGWNYGLAVMASDHDNHKRSSVEQ